MFTRLPITSMSHNNLIPFFMMTLWGVTKIWIKWFVVIKEDSDDSLGCHIVAIRATLGWFSWSQFLYIEAYGVKRWHTKSKSSCILLDFILKCWSWCEDFCNVPEKGMWSPFLTQLCWISLRNYAMISLPSASLVQFCG